MYLLDFEQGDMFKGGNVSVKIFSYPKASNCNKYSLTSVKKQTDKMKT